ncbi:MAG: AMP-dependent synthetase/ligase [Solirubrobacteraceae bacterium]
MSILETSAIRSPQAGPDESGAPAATLCQAFQCTARRLAGEPALRALGGPALSWGEYRAAVETASRRLHRLGVRPTDTVGMMLTNRPEFHVLDLAAVHLGATPFSLYNTSSPEQIVHVLHNADCRVLICERQFLDRITEARRDLEGLQHVVLLDGGREPEPGTRSLCQVEPSGSAELDYDASWQAVERQQIATIIYTSGTTGPPKGVLLSHANLLAAWASSVQAVPALSRRGRYISYLPTAHLADRMFSHYPVVMTGSEITCVADPRAAIARLGEICPTLFLAVPRIWEKLKDAVEAGFPIEQTGLKDADLLVSGAAPIHPSVLEFFAGRGLAICEGYGMTESTAIATLNRPGRGQLGTVGPPLPGIEVRLADDGEVLLRGPSVMVGYRHDQLGTAEALDQQGWLHTGDIGRCAKDGHLTIIDRKKELIINAAGKNMSPANIEAQLKAACPLIAHAIAIGDRRPYNTALIVLDRDLAALHAHRHRSADASLATLARDPELLTQLDAAVQKANTRLSRVEQIKRFTVLDHDWAPGGEELTPTLKPKRRLIAARYAPEIESMYAGSEPRTGGER